MKKELFANAKLLVSITIAERNSVYKVFIRKYIRFYAKVEIRLHQTRTLIRTLQTMQC